MLELIRSGLTQLGLSADKAEALTAYARLLVEKNKVMNLTALTSDFDVATLHMLDCAALAAHYPLNGKTIIDVGTGAGFPGMVLAILCPDANITLLDPLEKRLNFLREVSSALDLQNVTFLHGRGEDLGKAPEYRERFDYATARAVADLRVLGELCLPFVAVGGAFLSMKSVESAAELSAASESLQALGGNPLPPWDYSIPATSVTHRVLEIQKLSPTPEKFPRRWAKIQKEAQKALSERPL